MSLETSSLLTLRHLIGDISSDSSELEYTDNRLLELIYIAAVQVNFEIGGSYSINICSQLIDPEPDSTFSNLVALKAACLLTRSVQTSFAKCDFKVSDGPSSVDLKGASDKVKVSADSFCSQYEKAKLSFLMIDGGYGLTTPSSAS